jgi:hypothetical protein
MTIEVSVAGERWKTKPEAQDFEAAESYLSLLIGPAAAAKLVKALHKDELGHSVVDR